MLIWQTLFRPLEREGRLLSTVISFSANTFELNLRFILDLFWYIIRVENTFRFLFLAPFSITNLFPNSICHAFENFPQLYAFFWHKGFLMSLIPFPLIIDILDLVINTKSMSLVGLCSPYLFVSQYFLWKKTTYVHAKALPNWKCNLTMTPDVRMFIGWLVRRSAMISYEAR